MSYLSFSGSDRPGSINRRAVSLVLNAMRDQGLAINECELESLKLPLYTQVIEQADGYPAALRTLRAQLAEAQGLIIGCPEYNGLITPLLLNALTWLSRSESAEPDLSCFRLKPVLICSSSPGGLGGIRAAAELANYLRGIGGLIFPEFFIVPQGFSVFAESTLGEDHAMVQRATQLAQAFNQFSCTRSADEA